MSPEDQAELDALLDRWAARKGMSRVGFDEMRARGERATELAERSCGPLTLFAIVWFGIVETGVLVAFAVLYPGDTREVWKHLVVAGAALASTPFVAAGGIRVLRLVVRPDPRFDGLSWPNGDPRFDRLAWPTGMAAAWIWAGLFVIAASRLLT